MKAIESEDLLKNMLLKFSDIMNISTFLHNDIEKRGLVGNYFSFKIYIYSKDHKPPHAHIISNDNKGEFKISLDTFQITSSKGCNLKSYKLAKIKNIISMNQEKLINEFIRLNPQ